MRQSNSRGDCQEPDRQLDDHIEGSRLVSPGLNQCERVQTEAGKGRNPPRTPTVRNRRIVGLTSKRPVAICPASNPITAHPSTFTITVEMYDG